MSEMIPVPLNLPYNGTPHEFAAAIAQGSAEASMAGNPAGAFVLSQLLSMLRLPSVSQFGAGVWVSLVENDKREIEVVPGALSPSATSPTTTQP